MMAWKPVKSIFEGGTKEVRELYGRKVRLNDDFSGGISEDTVRIVHKRGLLGFVGHPKSDKLDHIIIAFPANEKDFPKNIDSLIRNGNFSTVEINWITFRYKFDIDV